MFNLKFSKSNDSPKMNYDMTVTRNDWTINGKVLDIKETAKGFWLRVKSTAKLSDIYALDRFEFDCFLPKTVAANSYKKNSYYKEIHAVGKFYFSKEKKYFIAQQLLV